MERVFTARELNRSLLARQLLLERSRLALPEALERVGGLQMQYAPSGYIGLWSRLADFRRSDLTAALESREVVQATLMRATIHLVSAADFWPLAAGLRRARREWWRRIRRKDLDGIDMDAATARARAFLEDGPRRQAEIVHFISGEGLPRIVWEGLGQWLDLVRVPPSGTWDRRRADLYGLAEWWLGPSTASDEDGLALLVRRYLGGFGPATLADAASWAGLPVTVLRPVAERLELRRFRDETGRELLDLPDASLPGGEAPAPVRFLPTWDANLLVHARRTEILPERYRPLIFSTRTPHSFPTFLVDGAVAGTWRETNGRIDLSPFEPLAREAVQALEEESEALAAFHVDDAPARDRRVRQSRR
ncbi:MAG TPA: winged helix DNA-binding domain-containing protein [Candidatus Limnocylindrales bacterium]|nr:winged helix DNA-binding domain-containing protein [Candidatus Limnocylindrales bacterium]